MPLHNNSTPLPVYLPSFFRDRKIMNVTPIRWCLPLLTLVAAAPLSAQVSTDCINELSGQDCDQQLNTITTAVPFLMISPDRKSVV